MDNQVHIIASRGAYDNQVQVFIGTKEEAKQFANTNDTTYDGYTIESIDITNKGCILDIQYH